MGSLWSIKVNHYPSQVKRAAVKSQPHQRVADWINYISLYSRTCIKRGHPSGMAWWSFKMGWPLDTGLPANDLRDICPNSLKIKKKKIICNALRNCELKVLVLIPWDNHRINFTWEIVLSFSEWIRSKWPFNTGGGQYKQAVGTQSRAREYQMRYQMRISNIKCWYSLGQGWPRPPNKVDH